MVIKKIKLYEVKIPFSHDISHNLKTRKESSSIVIEIETVNGIKYYGEGTPRPYVIHESVEDIVKTFQELAPVIATSKLEIEQIRFYSDKISDDYNLPSLSSALEIALLDLYGHKHQQSLETILNNSTDQLIPYSGIVTKHEGEQFVDYLNIIKRLNLPHVKIKVGSDRDEENLHLARKILGHDIDIRLDANQAWSIEDAISIIPRLEKYNISCVEEPLIKEDEKSLSRLSESITTSIMLDESIYNLAQAKKWKKEIDVTRLIFNLKISKCGGPLRASELYAYAKTHEIECSLGCNVGETAILSSVGRSFAQAHQLKYLEGSYSQFFMTADLTDPPPSFELGGISDAIKMPGIGLSIQEDSMLKYSTLMTTFTS